MNTKRTIIIATKNKKKYQSLKNLVVGTKVKINVKQIPEHYGSPEENGKNTLENARIKAHHYFKLTKENIMASDDGLYIHNIDVSQQVGTKIKRLNKNHEMTSKELFDFWWNRLAPHKTLSARRVRTILILDKNKNETIIKLILKVSLKRPTKIPIKLTDQPLNYFMTPDGYNVPISELSKKQKLEMQEQSSTELKSVLEKLN